MAAVPPEVAATVMQLRMVAPAAIGTPLRPMPLAGMPARSCAVAVKLAGTVP